MIAGVLQGLFNNGCVPLYYELAIEATYPVAELSVTGVRGGLCLGALKISLFGSAEA